MLLILEFTDDSDSSPRYASDSGPHTAPETFLTPAQTIKHLHNLTLHHHQPDPNSWRNKLNTDNFKIMLLYEHKL